MRERFLEIEQAYQDWQGSRLSKVVTAAEQQLATALQDGAHAQALEALERAYAAQQRINIQYASSSAKNIQAAVELERLRTELAAEPLHALVTKYVAEAQAARDLADWDNAIQQFEASVRAQLELNEKHRDAPQASIERLRELQETLRDLKAQQLEQRFKDALSAAEKAFQQGAISDAADHYETACQIQASFGAGQSRHFDSEIQRAAVFSQKLQTEMSQVTWQAIVDGMQQMDVLIQAANYKGLANRIKELTPLFEQMESQYATSQLRDPVLQEKFVFIRSRLNLIASIQELIYKALLPVPELDGVRLLRTELRRSTYLLVMEGNQVPSEALREKPMHSVSLAEAKLFCRRLGWLLAKSVDLPTEFIYRATLKGALTIDLQPYVWCDKDRVKEPQAVAKKMKFPSGFYDLMGNVGEWIAVENSDIQTYKSFGGDFKTPLSRLKSIPIYTFSQETRSRAIGFRIVVNERSDGRP